MSQIYQTSLSADGRYLAFVNRPFIIYGARILMIQITWHYYNENIFIDRVSGNIKRLVFLVQEYGVIMGVRSLTYADGRYLVFKPLPPIWLLVMIIMRRISFYVTCNLELFNGWLNLHLIMLGIHSSILP